MIWSTIWPRMFNRNAARACGIAGPAISPDLQRASRRRTRNDGLAQIRTELVEPMSAEVVGRTMPRKDPPGKSISILFFTATMKIRMCSASTTINPALIPNGVGRFVSWKSDTPRYELAPSETIFSAPRNQRTASPGNWRHRDLRCRAEPEFRHHESQLIRAETTELPPEHDNPPKGHLRFRAEIAGCCSPSPWLILSKPN